MWDKFNDRVYQSVGLIIFCLALFPPYALRAEVVIPKPVSIMQIQGTAQFSEYDAELIETTGVVTLYNSRGSSFWMQDPNGDGSSATSDGIFVSGGGFPKLGSKPAIGDLIRIVAEVQEQQFGNALPLTRLRRVKQIDIISQANPLPVAVKLTELPSENIADAILFWEALEGMLVTIRDARVVAPTSKFGEFTLISKANRKLDSGYYSESGHLLVRSTGNQMVDYNPERILVDDATLQSAIVVKPGDELEFLLAVVDYTFSNFKLQPLSYKVEIESLPSERLHQSDNNQKDEECELSLATFNLENLFDLEINPHKNDKSSTPTSDELATKLSKLVLAIRYKLDAPDIIVVQEIENAEILQLLAIRLNNQFQTKYDSISYESSDVRGIEVGFMWNKERVELKNAYPMTGNAVDQAFGPTSISPGREPLIGNFNFGGVAITVIGNHFKSKGGDDAIFGINQPAIRSSEQQRKLQARAVREHVDQLLFTDPDANIVVTGDFNDFPFAEPGEGDDHPIAILARRNTDIALYNLIEKVKPANRFTFIFDGNSQALDHMLVSEAMYESVKKVRIPHFNSNSPSNLANDPSTARRSSDHDPLRATFKFDLKED